MDDRCENNLKSSDRLKQEANDLAYCENYDKSSTEGRYGVRGSSLESRPELKGKRFKTVEELTSIGIDDIDIYDHRTGRGVTK